MAEESLSDPFPELKELESKTGRKIPESLLLWMRDAAEREDSWRSDVGERGDQISASDSFVDKINSLKQELRWLRSADVRILRRLVAVHEGIEATRWLMEERGTLTSRGSSLTGSLSSLTTVDEHGPSMLPCRESPSPGCDQEVIETKDEESAGQQPSHSDTGNSNHKRYLDMLRLNANLSRPKQDRFSFSPSKSLNVASLPKTQQVASDSTPVKNFRGDADIVGRALLRSSRWRREGEDAASCSFTQDSGESQQTQDGFSTSPSSEQEDAELCEEKLLLGYDAQWRWVESQDDVTFL